MKKLSVITCLLSLLISLSACSSYYYSNLSSTDKIGRMDENRNFVQENDTVRITYRFFGENAPVQISIFNKLDEPLFVDWQRSALIIGDVATSYYQDKAAITGKTESYSLGDSYNLTRRYDLTSGSSSGTFSGEVQLPKGTESIPPRSQVKYKSLMLDNLSFKHIPNDEFNRQPFAIANSELVFLRVKKYSEEDTPLRFRSYLALYTAFPNGERKEYVSFERSFYLSELIKAGTIKPANFQAMNRADGDFFYIHDYKKGRNAGLIIGAIAIGTAGVVLESTLDPDYRY